MYSISRPPVTPRTTVLNNRSIFPMSILWDGLLNLIKGFSRANEECLKQLREKYEMKGMEWNGYVQVPISLFTLL